MKKIFALSFIAILMLSFALSVIPLSFADHDAHILWAENLGTPYERYNTTTYRPVFPGGKWPWLNFTVEARWLPDERPTDPIYKLVLEIPKDGAGLAEFQYWRSIIYDETGNVAQRWQASPEEIDNNGWPTVVIFENVDETNPIMPGETYRFSMEFKATRVTTCSRTFIIYTIDRGISSQTPETEGHELILITDPDMPEEPNRIHPTDSEGTSTGNPIIAIFDPYPTHWYMNLEFTVRDMLEAAGADHDTGVSRIEVSIYDYIGDTIAWSRAYPPAPQTYWERPVRSDLVPLDPLLHITEKVYDLASEYARGIPYLFRLTINVFDGARNVKPWSRDFLFKVPSYFRITPVNGTVGRFDNTLNSIGEWRGSISDTYEGLLGDYQLGTEVIAEGLEPLSPPTVGFTPNSWVNVYVYHPIQGRILVRWHVPTDSRGRFQAPFLFPKGPNGIYRVEAVDEYGITDFAWFEVLSGVIFMPDVVTGPAKVEVIASGLPVGAEVDSDSSSIWVDRFLIDDLDAILSVNNHVIFYWYVDDWGVLHSTMADNDARGLPQQGFFMPLLESGKYVIAFRTPGQRWERDHYRTRDASMDYWKPSFTMQVATKFDEIKSLINTRIGEVNMKITSVNETVVKFVIPKLGTIDGKADDIITRVKDVKIVADRIDGAAVTIEAKVKDLPEWTQEIHGWISDINGDWTTVTTDVGNIKLDTTQLLKDVAPGVSTLSTPAMLTVVLSAIAAIAAVISVIVVVRRLKVAS